MGPTIQLIQLTLRVEREMEAQRRPSTAYSNDFAVEKPVRPSKRENLIQSIFNLFDRQQQCECA